MTGRGLNLDLNLNSAVSSKIIDETVWNFDSLRSAKDAKVELIVVIISMHPPGWPGRSLG